MQDSSVAFRPHPSGRARWPFGRMALGAGLHVLVSGVTAVGTRALMGRDLDTSWLWLAAALVALTGPVLGALVAGWGREDGPAIGSCTAAVGALILAVVTVVRRLGGHHGLPLTGMLAVAAIEVALGLVGGLLARRFGS